MSDLNSFKDTTIEAAKLEMEVLAARLNVLAMVVGTGPSPGVPGPAPASTVKLAESPAKRRGRPAGSKNKAKASKPTAAVSASGNGKAEAAAAPEKTITAKQRKARKLQGKFLSLIRLVPAGEREQYKQLIKSNGKDAAIEALQKALGK